MRTGRPMAHLFLMLTILLTIFIGSAQTVLFIYFDKEGPLKSPKILVIPPRTPLYLMAEKLRDAGIIKHPLLFTAAVKILKFHKRLYAGEYAFATSMSPRQIAEMMIGGKSIVHRLTIPEGLTTTEIIRLINEEPVLVGTVNDDIKQGELLPETYFFSYGESKQQMVERMRIRMQHTLKSLWETRAANLPLQTPEQAIVLASIVEKETGIISERSRVAAVFMNRLRLHMRLQSDPTVTYALTHGESELGRTLTHNDLKIVSPYNTYVTDGLPPSPIANPGKAAIEAVLHPLVTNELYFVATGTGGHHFAATLGEHNRNVDNYRLRVAKPQ